MIVMIKGVVRRVIICSTPDPFYLHVTTPPGFCRSRQPWFTR